MPVAIALLRGLNVGGRNMLPMATLRSLCAGIGLQDVQTYIQSGNIIFRAPARDLTTAANRLEDAIEAAREFRPRIIIRSLEDLRATAAANPFSSGVDAAKLLVMFLVTPPPGDAATSLSLLIAGPEEFHLRSREIYLHFPSGIGKSKLSMAAVESALRTPGTCRNWNTIQKLLTMAESLPVRLHSHSRGDTATSQGPSRYTPGMAHLPLHQQSRRGHGALLLALLLAVVIGIFLMYGNMGGTSYMKQVGTTRQQGKQMAQDINTRQLSTLLANHRSVNGKLPKTTADLGDDAIYFKDQWGNPLTFTFEESRVGPTKVTYRSPGPDGEANTEDDIVKTETLPF